MGTSLLNKPRLWSFRETAEIFNLTLTNDYRVISRLVVALGIEPKETPNPSAKGLDINDLKMLAKTLNRTLDLPAS